MMKLLRTEEMELHQFINTGSCGQYMVHLKLIEVTDWNIKATAKCAFQILHDAPARMADYTSVSGSSIFFLFFCATRWVEDRKVAKRLLEIWLHNSKVVAFWL